MLKLFLWLRYLRKKKIVFLSIAAVALSVALLIVVDSLFTGFIEQVKKADITGEGDIAFSAPSLIPKERIDPFIEQIKKISGVKSAAPSIDGSGLLWLGKGDVRETIINTIDIKHESDRSDLKNSLLRQADLDAGISFDVPGYPDEIGGLVGIGIVAEPNEKTDEYDTEEVRKLIGTQVVLTTSGWGWADAAGEDGEKKWKLKRRVIKFRIADIFHSGIFYRDHSLYLPYNDFYRLRFRDSNQVNVASVRIDIADGVEYSVVKDAVQQIWETFAADELGWSAGLISKTAFEDPQQRLGPFLAELKKQLSVLLLIFAVICSVAVLLIFCIFYMIVMTKQKDIAVIKSFGASRGTTATIFTGFGVCVGLVGSGFGVLLGYIVTSYINTIENWVRIVFGMKLWRSSVYMFEKIPNQVDWPAMWWIVLAAVAGCCLGSIVPAIVAARTKPVEILRYE